MMKTIRIVCLCFRFDLKNANLNNEHIEKLKEEKLPDVVSPRYHTYRIPPVKRPRGHYILQKICKKTLFCQLLLGKTLFGGLKGWGRLIIRVGALNRGYKVCSLTHVYTPSLDKV